MSQASEIIVAVYKVRRAIQDHGPQPWLHRRIMRRHRLEWPTLWVALDQLLAATKDSRESPGSEERKEQ